MIDPPVRSALSANQGTLFAAFGFSFHVVPYGLAVKIPGFHPDGLNSAQGYAGS